MNFGRERRKFALKVTSVVAAGVAMVAFYANHEQRVEWRECIDNTGWARCEAEHKIAVVCGLISVVTAKMVRSRKVLIINYF